MEFHQLTEMITQSKLIMMHFLREFTGNECIIYFNENAYDMHDNAGDTYKLTKLIADDQKITVDKRYINGHIEEKHNILQMTSNELYVLCIMINVFKEEILKNEQPIDNE